MTLARFMIRHICMCNDYTSQLDFDQLGLIHYALPTNTCSFCSWQRSAATKKASHNHDLYTPSSFGNYLLNIDASLNRYTWFLMKLVKVMSKRKVSDLFLLRSVRSFTPNMQPTNVANLCWCQLSENSRSESEIVTISSSNALLVLIDLRPGSFLLFFLQKKSTSVFHSPREALKNGLPLKSTDTTAPNALVFSTVSLQPGTRGSSVMRSSASLWVSLPFQSCMREEILRIHRPIHMQSAFLWKPLVDRSLSS